MLPILTVPSQHSHRCHACSTQKLRYGPKDIVSTHSGDWGESECSRWHPPAALRSIPQIYFSLPLRRSRTQICWLVIVCWLGWIFTNIGVPEWRAGIRWRSGATRRCIFLTAIRQCPMDTQTGPMIRTLLHPSTRSSQGPKDG